MDQPSNSDVTAEPSTRNIKLVIAYEGTNYSGWQRQSGAVTVQETIESALADIIGRSVTVRGASRTDAGVHAEGQVASVRVTLPMPAEAFARVLNGRLPADIVVKSSERVRDDFNASRDPICKAYLYRIYTASQREVRDFRRRWHLPYSLDIRAMNAAAELLLGTHDYAGFASSKDDRDNTVRTVIAASVDRSADDEVDFHITADRFLYHMVRNIVGSVVEIGRGRWPVERIAQILVSRDRTQAGPTAPPQGLCLMHIDYPDRAVPSENQTGGP